MSAVAKVPTLRFPGFSEEWAEAKFGDIYNFIATNSFSRALLNYESGSIRNIHYGDIHTKYRSNFNVKNEDVPFINEEVDVAKIKEEQFCKEKDLVIADASEDYADIGKTLEIIDLDNQKVVAGLHTYIAREKEDFMALGFAGYLMQTHNVRLQMMKYATGISVLGISKGNLGKLELHTPKKPEQQKIASFLTAVDSKIEQLTKKHSLLEQYKKGVMQKIFSREIRFRAEDGSAFPEWEEKKLGEIFEQRTEKNAGDLELLSVTMNDGIKKRTELEGKDNSSSDKSNYRKVCKNDIVYNSMRMWQGASGVSDYDGIVSPAYTVLESNEENSSIYFGYLFKTIPMIHIFQRNSQGLTSDTWNLKYPQLATIKINAPKIKEQTKIADFFSSIDTKIDLVTKELESAKKFKKGLLQQMFV